jgi:hypothetical protein
LSSSDTSGAASEEGFAHLLAPAGDQSRARCSRVRLDESLEGRHLVGLDVAQFDVHHLSVPPPLDGAEVKGLHGIVLTSPRTESGTSVRFFIASDRQGLGKQVHDLAVQEVRR